MGFWNFVIENKEEVQEERAFKGQKQLNSFIMGTTGDKLDSDTVLSIPTAKICYDLIIGSIKNLDIKLYKRDKDGDLIEVEDDYRLKLLNEAPNDFSNGTDFKEKFFGDLLLHGNAYAEVVRTGNKIDELWNIDASKVMIKKYTDMTYSHRIRDIVYTIDGTYDIDVENMMYCVTNSDDGIHGKGVIHFGDEILRLALSELALSSSIMESGSAPSSVIEVDTHLSEEAGNRLKQSWTSLFSGAKNKGKVLILEEGMKYKQMSLSPNELGLTTSRTTTSSELCRLFGVPENLVDNSSNLNIETSSMMLVQTAISPLLKSAEESLNRALLTRRERNNGGYEFKIDSSDVIKTTLQDRYDSYIKGINGSFLGISEVRRKEGMKPFDKEFFKMSIGNTLYYPEDGIYFNPNNSSTYNENTGELKTPELQVKEQENGNIKDNSLQKEEVPKDTKVKQEVKEEVKQDEKE